MSVSPCCFKAFEWDGRPTGKTAQLANINTYITGSNPSAAVLIIHDLFGWDFPNVRLLADHYAREAEVTVYVPDFFYGDSLDRDALLNDRWAELDVAGFLERNGREQREADIFACARILKDRHGKLGAAGFCYGGWAAFRLGAASHSPPLVDCITVAHPSLLTKADIDGVGVPVQILAAELDPVYTAELKMHTFTTVPSRGVAFDYQHFPGVVHSCLVRGDERKPGERAAMERGKNAAVAWLRQFLDQK